MANREYFVGDQIKADGDYYTILGKITFRNKADGMTWDEYRLRSVQFSSEERWLSVDNAYNEFSLSKINPSAASMTTAMGYHCVDRGIEQVIAVSGDVGDVEVGDTASFEEYEDYDEERIISIENWDDGTESSSGYYLDPWEFGKDGESATMHRLKSGVQIGNLVTTILVMLIIGIAFIAEYAPSLLTGNKKIEKYVKGSSSYEYVTSITGSEKQKANVYEYKYSSPITTDGTTNDAQLTLVAQDIIDGVDGNTESVQQNDEEGDQTIAILTDKEYCIIYRGEDDKIYVQVSTRKYAYTSDQEPYHSRNRTRRYYRRFYYSRGYSSDSSTYSSSQSSYGGYSDGTISYDSNNSLNGYSNSVRQSSAASRSSSGGGLSSGK